MVRPSRTTLASASTSELATARMKWVAADNTAVPAQSFGESHAQHFARLPVGRSARGRLTFDASNRQPEVLHPGSEHLAKDASCFLDIEFRSVRAFLHGGWFPTLATAGSARSGANGFTGRCGLKMPGHGFYDRESRGSASRMFRRLALFFSIVAMGLVLDGCTKCGPIWDDWTTSPKSCKSDHL